MSVPLVRDSVVPMPCATTKARFSSIESIDCDEDTECDENGYKTASNLGYMTPLLLPATTIMKRKNPQSKKDERHMEQVHANQHMRN